MPLQFSTPLRNARLDAIETVVGTAAVLKMFAGSKPANTAAADAGTVVATIALPADWMQNASGASKAMSGTWEDNSADATGTATYYRIYDSAGVCHIMGTVTNTGGGGDITVDSVNFNAGQAFKVTAYAINEANG